MAFDNYGAPQFGLNDCKVATWTATDTYGTEVDVPSVQMMGTSLQQVSAQLEGDDQITDTQSSVTGVEVRLRFGSVSLAALEVILGQAISSSGSTPNRVSQIKLGGSDKMPYFGICGAANATQGTGDTHVFIPKAKVMGNVALTSMEYGQYAIPELTVFGVNDTTYDAMVLIEHETATAVAIPPTNVQ
jgi:hypothetical protein